MVQFCQNCGISFHEQTKTETVVIYFLKYFRKKVNLKIV